MVLNFIWNKALIVLSKTVTTMDGHMIIMCLMFLAFVQLGQLLLPALMFQAVSMILRLLNGSLYMKDWSKCIIEMEGGALLIVLFPKKYDFLIKSSQTLPDAADEILINEEATSMHQSAEWGMSYHL